MLIVNNICYSILLLMTSSMYVLNKDIYISVRTHTWPLYFALRSSTVSFYWRKNVGWLIYVSIGDPLGSTPLGARSQVAPCHRTTHIRGQHRHTTVAPLTLVPPSLDEQAAVVTHFDFKLLNVAFLFWVIPRCLSVPSS